MSDEVEWRDRVHGTPSSVLFHSVTRRGLFNVWHERGVCTSLEEKHQTAAVGIRGHMYVRTANKVKAG